MKIEFKTPPDTGTAVTLASSGDIVDGYKVSPERNIDVFKPVRATAVEYYDRGCESNTVSFNVITEHASAEAAMQYINELSASLPTGTGTLIVTTGTGATPAKQHLINAVILKPKDVPQIGCSTITPFVIMGGTFQSTDPNA